MHREPGYRLPVRPLARRTRQSQAFARVMASRTSAPERGGVNVDIFANSLLARGRTKLIHFMADGNEGNFPVEIKHRALHGSHAQGDKNIPPREEVNRYGDAMSRGLLNVVFSVCRCVNFMMAHLHWKKEQFRKYRVDC